MAPSPIALFVYNRPDHTRQTVEALKKNELAAETDLFVFSDVSEAAPTDRRVRDVRNYVQGIQGFKSIRVISREKNLGLAGSIIDGVNRVCGEYGRVIVLEDDLITSPFFLTFMNHALDTYADDDRVGSVHGYWYPVGELMPDTFFLRIASSWGWATWSRAWRLFERDGAKLLSELRSRRLTDDFDLDGAMPYTRMLKDQIAGRNDSWAIRWDASLFLGGRMSLYPGTSLVRNIGFDGSGRHSPASSDYDSPLAAAPIALARAEPAECLEARDALIRFYRSRQRGFLTRAAAKLRRMAGI